MDKLLDFKAWLEAGEPMDPNEKKLVDAQRTAIAANAEKGRQGALNAAHAVIKAQSGNQAIDPKMLLKHIPEEPPVKGMKKHMKKKMGRK